MGQDKLVMPWGEATVIESQLASWRDGGVDEIVVVMRRDQVALRELCRTAIVVTPTIPPPEMKDSVLAALDDIRTKFAPDARDVWLLAPADMPQLDAQVIRQLLVAHDAARPTIIVPIRNRKRGHPVLFPWGCADEVSRLSADEGVNKLLDRFPVRELECPAASIHGDLDTPEDYRQLKDGLGE
ncbi:MAG: NTP transferase domain-containing protein [Planctomycetaceae bacterium]|nr:NTP transferase domain-containing protein [Planctomycetaceae bacterium]